jgi:hypothetical protein
VEHVSHHDPVELVIGEREDDGVADQERHVHPDLARACGQLVQHPRREVETDHAHALLRERHRHLTGTGTDLEDDVRTGELGGEHPGGRSLDLGGESTRLVVVRDGMLEAKRPSDRGDQVARPASARMSRLQ